MEDSQQSMQLFERHLSLLFLSHTHSAASIDCSESSIATSIVENLPFWFFVSVVDIYLFSHQLFFQYQLAICPVLNIHNAK
jgi:hypothetical protein